jgi:methionyl-tRNA formyltransferase
MRILFMGTGDICLPTLDWLIRTSKHDLLAVVTQPDRPVGRRLVLTPPEVKLRAQAVGIPVHQPEKLKLHLDELRPYQADIAVVMAYGQILNRETLELPRHGCINIHASLLPRHRGAAPIQAAIRDGDAASGVTIMHIARELDAGDIILMRSIPLASDETGGSLHDKLAQLAPHALEDALDHIAAGTAARTPQDHALATHTGKLSRENGRIDWTHDAASIERMVRAYDPWPGCHTVLPDGSVLKIHAVRAQAGSSACAAPGTVIAADAKSGLLISTGSSLLEIKELQAPNGKRLTASDYLRGHSIEVGSRWSA